MAESERERARVRERERERVRERQELDKTDGWMKTIEKVEFGN